MKRLAIVVLLAMFWSYAGLSQVPGCSSAKANKADREASTLRTWDALYSSFRRFARCDDGSIAEGYSESVARILADHWNTLPRLSVLSKNDARFQRFVLRHIDATLDMDDVKKIRKNAILHCPSGENELCGKLKIAAYGALKENGITIKPGALQP